MKIKAEDLKAGQVIKQRGLYYTVLYAVKRFYKNGRAKMEVGARVLGEPKVEDFTFKADTKLEIYGEL